MSFMSKIKMGALAAAAVSAISTAASAAVIVLTPVSPGPPPANPYFFNTDIDSATFGANKNSTASFSDVYTFNVSGDGLASSSAKATAVLTNTDTLIITGADLDGQAFSANGASWDLSNWPIFASGNSHKLTVNGYVLENGNSKGSYSGTLSVAAVPEPATWGMMLVGFGLVGAGVRSRKRSMVLA